MKFLSTCIVVFALSLSGCVTPSGVSTVADSGLSGAPSWVLNPEKAGYVSIVGSAEKQDFGGRDAQYRVAMMKARQELAQMIRVNVKSSSRFKTEVSKDGLTRDSDIETRLQSAVAMNLESSQVVAEWVDPKSGTLYLWVVTPN